MAYPVLKSNTPPRRLRLRSCRVGWPGECRHPRPAKPCVCQRPAGTSSKAGMESEEEQSLLILLSYTCQCALGDSQALPSTSDPPCFSNQLRLLHSSVLNLAFGVTAHLEGGLSFEGESNLSAVSRAERQSHGEQEPQTVQVPAGLEPGTPRPVASVGQSGDAVGQSGDAVLPSAA